MDHEDFPEEDRARAAMFSAIQDVIHQHEPGAMLTRFFLVYEATEIDKGVDHRRLAYRTSDINRKTLTSWDSQGFLRSAMVAVDEQSREGLEAVYLEDDDDDETDDQQG